MEGEQLGGAGHVPLVQQLKDRLEVIASGDLTVPRVVVLEGASGTGKSRIVRGLYRTLQGRQPLPAYWPPMPEHGTRTAGAGVGLDPVLDRKQLGPPLAGFVWPAGSLPSFGWWVLDCDRMSRGDLQGAEAILKQFDLALPGLGLGLSWLRRGLGAFQRHREEQAKCGDARAR